MALAQLEWVSSLTDPLSHDLHLTFTVSPLTGDLLIR